MSEGVGAVAARPKSVTIDLGWLADDAEEIVTAIEEADRIVEALRDLADPRITLPDLATLRERLRESVGDLDRAHEKVIDLADGVADRVRDALAGDDEDEAGT
jgi:hypothetical protein